MRNVRTNAPFATRMCGPILWYASATNATMGATRVGVSFAEGQEYPTRIIAKNACNAKKM